MSPPLTRRSRGDGTPLAGVVERNIRTLVDRRRDEEVRRPAQDRLADAITRFTGSMRFVYLHLVLFGLWIAINLGLLPFIPRFDESFGVLAMVASAEAIFLSTSSSSARTGWRRCPTGAPSSTCRSASSPSTRSVG